MLSESPNSSQAVGGQWPQSGYAHGAASSDHQTGKQCLPADRLLKGLKPSVGGTRSMIIECLHDNLAFPKGIASAMSSCAIPSGTIHNVGSLSKHMRTLGLWSEAYAWSGQQMSSSL